MFSIINMTHQLQETLQRERRTHVIQCLTSVTLLWVFFFLLSGKIQTKWFILHPEPSVCHLYQTWITAKWQLSANRALATPRRPILHLLMSRASGTIAHTVTQSAVTSQQLFFKGGFFLSGDKLSNAFWFFFCFFLFSLFFFFLRRGAATLLSHLRLLVKYLCIPIWKTSTLPHNLRAAGRVLLKLTELGEKNKLKMSG